MYIDDSNKNSKFDKKKIMSDCESQRFIKNVRLKYFKVIYYSTRVL